MKKLVSILSVLLLLSFPKAETYPTASKHIGNWDGNPRYSEGYSEWMTYEKIVETYGDNANILISQGYSSTVWFQVSFTNSYTLDNVNSGEVKTCTLNTYNTGSNASSCYLRDLTGSQATRWVNKTTTPPSCGGSGYRSGSGNGGDRCNCSVNKSDPTGWYAIAGTPSYQACNSNDTHYCGSGPCTVGSGKNKRVYDVPCYWYKCYSYQAGSEVCGSSGETSAYNGCAASRWNYSYRDTPANVDRNDKTLWKRSQSSAGEFSMSLNVFSVPLNYFINFDGNGSDGACTFETGTNTFSNASNIKYDLGNPVCSGSNTTAMTRQEMDYFNATELNQLEYYRNGYDFTGWNTKPDGTGTSFNNGQSITKDDVNAIPGEAITLYAQWKLHDYKIDYVYDLPCANNNAITKYNYQNSQPVTDLDTEACDPPTTFIGWYEELKPDGEYSGELDMTPNDYYKDLVLYAKLRQRRVYNYGDPDNEGNWSIIK